MKTTNFKPNLYFYHRIPLKWRIPKIRISKQNISFVSSHTHPGLCYNENIFYDIQESQVLLGNVNLSKNVNVKLMTESRLQW